jgi:hypothetical protein
MSWGRFVIHKIEGRTFLAKRRDPDSDPAGDFEAILACTYIRMSTTNDRVATRVDENWRLRV